MYRLHFHIYAKAEELDLLEILLDSENLLCIKSPLLIITEHSDKALKVVSHFIKNNLYKNYILNRLKIMYNYFSLDEIEIILNDVMTSIDDFNIFENLKKMHFGVNLHSFVLFYMQGELDDINSLIDTACEYMHARHEYFDYIRLLKYYVNMHETKCDTVNLLFTKGGFDLTDKDFKSLAGGVLNAETAILEEDDSLISVLVDIAPNKIIIHNERFAHDVLLDTIVNVFSKKTVFCKGCVLCTNFNTQS